MSYRCDACGESFDTLSRKRLHECPSGAPYGGDEPAEELDVSGDDSGALAERAVEKVLVCEVCGERNDGADDFEHTVNENGIALAVTFTCETCGAVNENTATMKP